MNISAYNKEGKERELEYVMTYSPRHPEKSRNISFPLELENSDAEAMLHAIGQLAQKPEVKELLDKLIYGYRKDGDLIWLVNNVTSEFKNVIIVWNEISCYLHFKDSIAVNCGPWQFQFPDECSLQKCIKRHLMKDYFKMRKKGLVCL
jgi:hypothetical protein